MIIQNGKISMATADQDSSLYPVSSSQRYHEGLSNEMHCANTSDNGTVVEDKGHRTFLSPVLVQICRSSVSLSKSNSLY